MKWLCLVSGILLIVAIPSGWPYDFYILLRWVIFVSSIITAYVFFKSKLEVWSIIFGAIAFLFNPLYPIYLEKSGWVAIDFITATIFFIAAFSAKKSRNK